MTAGCPDFDGSTYDQDRDGQRLGRLLDRVYNLMIDGSWRNLTEIQARCGGSEPSVSARLRDLRKAKHGSLLVERRYVSNGVWEYRLLVPCDGQLKLAWAG